MISSFSHSVLYPHGKKQCLGHRLFLFFFHPRNIFSSKNLPQAAESISFSPKPPQLRVHFPFCQGQSMPMERLVVVTSDWGAMVQAGESMTLCSYSGSGEPIGQEPRKFEGSSRVRKKRGPQTYQLDVHNRRLT